MGTKRILEIDLLLIRKYVIIEIEIESISGNGSKSRNTFVKKIAPVIRLTQQNF